MDGVIQVSENGIPAQLGASLRYGIAVVTAWAVGRGYIGSDTAGMLGAIALIAIPWAYGQIKQWSRHADTVTLVKAVPESVATLK